MAAYDLYGSTSQALDDIRSSVEKALGVTFEARESSYQGGDYYRYGPAAGEHFVLKSNVDPYDGEPAETRFPQYPTLLYVNSTSRSAELRGRVEALTELTLLRHEDF